MTSTIGIPIKLLNEAQVRPDSLFERHDSQRSEDIPMLEAMLTLELSQGHVVTLEITSGQVYRGRLLEGSFSQPRSQLPPLSYEQGTDS
jgi:hypothetical protein